MSNLLSDLLTSPWLFILALAGVGFLILHTHTRAALILWGLGLLMIVQNSAWTVEILAQPLLQAAQQLSIDSGCLDEFPVLVVLGGGLRTKDRLSYSSQERVERAADFLVDKSKTVILSGGPTLRDQPTTEAALAERDLRRLLGEKANSLKILREEQSLSTHQNAVGTLQLMQKENLGQKVILVTNVFHMRRAVATFSKQGFMICALPSYPPLLKPNGPMSYANAFWLGMLAHEYFGYWYYWLRGWV